MMCRFGRVSMRVRIYMGYNGCSIVLDTGIGNDSAGLWVADSVIENFLDFFEMCFEYLLS